MKEDTSTPQTDPTPFRVVLTEEQHHVVNRVKIGRSLFFTGSAGTGKSVVLREIIRKCRTEGRRLSVTASTGIAAFAIDGTSLHHWAGIGLGIGTAKVLARKILASDKFRKNMLLRRKGIKPGESWEEYVKRVNAYGTAYDRWCKTDVLVIDEISMIHGNLFDKLEELARRLRCNNKPFGGIQLVIAGDFYQLPPVWKAKYQRPKFAFEAKTWERCVGKTMILTQVFRQKDEKFITMLNSVRIAKVNRFIINILKELSRKVDYDDGIEPVDVFPNSADVVAENLRRLEKLNGDSHKYPAYDIAGINKDGIPFDDITVARALEDAPAPSMLELKVGAKVMLIKNLVQGYLLNGTQGVVMEFISTSEAQRRQIPIASSDIREQHLFGEPSSKRRRVSEEREDSPLYPVVQFNTKGKRLLQVLCVPHAFSVDTLDGLTQLGTRHQIPLELSWAMTIHKCQGQSIERLRVHLGRAFLPGQVYVALSRAVRMDTLEVCGFNVKKITAHPVVVKWMNTQSLVSLQDGDDDFVQLPMSRSVTPVLEPDGVNIIVINPEDLLHNLPPQPDDMPYSETHSSEDEPWTQIGDSPPLSSGNIRVAKSDDTGPNNTRPKRRHCSPGGDSEEDDFYWSQVEDIEVLLDGKLLDML